MSEIDRDPIVPVYRRPWWVGAAILLMGVVWLRGASAIHSTTNVIGIGPSVMVEASGALLVVCGLLLIFQALKGVPFKPQEEEGADLEAPPSRQSFLLALAGVGLPLLAMQRLGFPLVAAVSFALVTHAFGSRRTVLDLVIGAIVSCLSWYCFSLLGINLGPFLPLIG
jgi:putative tricarboxylic transport membrane protein